MYFTIPFFHKDFPNKTGKVWLKNKPTITIKTQNKTKKPHLQVVCSLVFLKKKKKKVHFVFLKKSHFE